MNTTENPTSDPPIFTEDELEFLSGLKEASDEVYEETGCGVEFGCSVTSDSDSFEVIKSLAAKGYVEADAFPGSYLPDPWDVPPGDVRFIEYYPTHKFTVLMGVKCHRDATENPQADAR